MLTNITFLKDLSIEATDGKLGTVEQFYFDDETWTIRYFIVNTGGWLSNRLVLISPWSVTRVDWEAQLLHVSLTKKQVQDSPNVDTHKPVSRQHEEEYLGYYGIPYYWGGPYLWGSKDKPEGIDRPISGAPDIVREISTAGSADSHLRSTDTVHGYHVQAKDGEIGHVNGFIIDDDSWSIRYLQVTTRNWLPGKTVLISPEWVERLSWTDSKIYVDLTVEAIKDAPEYLLSKPLTREYEDRLYLHYGRPPYWVAEHETALTHTGV
jgi:hypothetical protein